MNRTLKNIGSKSSSADLEQAGLLVVLPQRLVALDVDELLVDDVRRLECRHVKHGAVRAHVIGVDVVQREHVLHRDVLQLPGL